ncbi:glycosyltransferase [bacterium]|nr:glycosyltransferase [bacterium]MBU1616037.1 glycosyltransferase [bacterium]
MAGLPEISVVTPSYNQGAFIEEAILSVRDQNYPNTEHIIMDGGSMDNTLEILKRYEGTYNMLWASEPDNGLYEALNKGICMAKGDFIGWLNSDDVYSEGVFEAVVGCFQKEPDVMAICGDATLFRDDSSGRQTICTYRHYRGHKFEPNSENLHITHLNACFFRRSVYQLFGLFDIQYKIAADRDFILRLMKQPIKSSHIGRVTYRYRTHKNSLTFSQLSSISSRPTLLPHHPACKELIDICKRHMFDKITPKIIYNWCLRLHSDLTLNQFLYGLQSKQYKEMFKSIVQGTQCNLLWPFYAFRNLITMCRMQ